MKRIICALMKLFKKEDEFSTFDYLENSKKTNLEEKKLMNQLLYRE